MKNLSTVAILICFLCFAFQDAKATANYVYHEQTTNVVGCNSIPFLTNTTPPWGSPIEIAFKVEYQNYTNQARIYYTNDGTEPQGAFGTGTGTTQVIVASFQCTYSSGGTVDVWRGTIPSQNPNTTIRYKISAWHSGGGDEIFANSGTCGGCNPKTVSSDVPGWSFSTPLPIQLASFTATSINNAVRLDWRTISEINNYGFYVERRANDNGTFTELPNSFVAGRGTTNTPQEYRFTDNLSIGGSAQYRLRQVDLDGTIHYTEPVSVNTPTSIKELAPIEFALKQNYPNPFNPETIIKFSVEQTDRATIEIYNMLGQKLVTLFDDIVEAGYYQSVKFNGADFASGTYIYRLTSGKKSELKKLLLLK